MCSSLFIYKKTGGSCWYFQSVSHFLPSRTISPQKQLVLCCFYLLIIQSMNLPVISFLFPTFYWKHSSRMPTMISLMFTPALSSDLKLLKFGLVATSIFMGHFSSALRHWFLEVHSLLLLTTYILLLCFSVSPLVLVSTRILSSVPFKVFTLYYND